MPWKYPSAVTWNQPSENQLDAELELLCSTAHPSFSPNHAKAQMDTAEWPCCLLWGLQLQFSSDNWEFCPQQTKCTMGLIRGRADVGWGCVCVRKAACEVMMCLTKALGALCKDQRCGIRVGSWDEGLSRSTECEADKNPKSG